MKAYMNGSAPVAPKQLSLFPSKLTYSQNWLAYNKAQCGEKARFVELLTDLCKLIPQPEYTFGRPRLPLADMTFACAYKVYSGFSTRRFTSDLKDAQSKGFIHNQPHFTSVSNYLADTALTPILMNLVTISSLPLKSVETNFAIDSSGFSTSRFIRWFNKKYGREVDNREWVKCHLMCGTKTHTVSSVEISGWTAHDTNYFEPLLKRTAKHFHVNEVSMDKAYLSHKNLELAALAGAIPYVPFKSNTVPPEWDGSIWARTYYQYMLNKDVYMSHYHRRSNVETVFSMLKGKFGDAVRSKSDVGQINEVLCKVLCHNVCVLIQSFHELGIEPAFSQTLCGGEPYGSAMTIASQTIN